MSKRHQTKFVDEAKFVEDEVELLEERIGNLEADGKRTSHW